MATKLFLRSTQTNGIGATYFDMVTTAGAGSTTAATTTTASGTEIQWTQSAGGAELLFVSGRAPAGGFTLTTTDISVWCHESASAVNTGGAYRIFKRASGGTETELGGGLYSDGVEFTKTTPTEMLWTGNPTDTAFAEDDRILLKIKAVPVGTMGAGTVTLTYNAADAATGDSFFNIAETVTFKAESVSVALTATANATGSAGLLAASISTALAGNEATGAAGTLTPSAAYSVALTGNEATASAGSIAASIAIALLGNEATGAAGTLTASSGINVALTGNEAAGAAGSLAASISAALSGNEAIGAAGSLTVSITAALTGNEAVGFAGTLNAAVAAALAGNEATGAAGTLSAAISAALFGNAATASAGVLTVAGGGGGSVVVIFQGISNADGVTNFQGISRPTIVLVDAGGGTYTVTKTHQIYSETPGSISDTTYLIDGLLP